jgi:hypothetical protein
MNGKILGWAEKNYSRHWILYSSLSFFLKKRPQTMFVKENIKPGVYNNFSLRKLL